MPRIKGSVHSSYKNAGRKSDELDEKLVKTVKKMLRHNHKIKTICEKTGLSRFKINKIYLTTIEEESESEISDQEDEQSDQRNDRQSRQTTQQTNQSIYRNVFFD